MQIAGSSEISSMTFDSTSNRLALCTREGVVQVYIVGGKSDLEPIFSVQLDSFLAKSIEFGKVENDLREIMVFGLSCGRM